MSDPNVPTETPNLVIENPKTREKLNNVFSVLLLLLGVAALFFAFFPELAPQNDLFGRLESFLIAAITLISAWFGLGGTRKHYPKF